MPLSRLWIAIAAKALILGGVTWLLKLWVIVPTDGRVVATGAVATFLELGPYLFIAGSTRVGLRDLAADRFRPARGRMEYTWLFG